MKYFVSLILLGQLILVFSCDKSKVPATPPPSPPVDTVIHLTGLSIDPNEFLSVTTLTKQLTVNTTPADADNKDVTWISSDNSIATVNSSGLVTVLKTGLVTITAKSKENSVITATAKLTVLKDYDVYAVGTGNSTQYLKCALCWKNGKGSTLPGGLNVGSEANAIIFSGSDEYIVGSTLNANHWGVATYWKNGVPHILGPTNVDRECWPMAIAVEGNRVVVAGFTFYDSECPAYCRGRSRAAYWTDSAGTITQTNLNNAIASTTAYGVAFKDGDIIVAGSRTNNSFGQWTCWWKNDTATSNILSPLDAYYATTSMAVHGTDTYFTGYGSCTDKGCDGTACLWKNDGAHTTALTDGSRDAHALCIAFSGNTIYVGGYEKNEAGKSVAKYWKIDGNKISVRTVSDGTISSSVQGIAVAGNDIFLIGQELNDTGESKAKCWRTLEGGTNTLSVDASDFYLPKGLIGKGIWVK